VSARAPAGRILLTPTNSPLGTLAPDELLELDGGGELGSGVPASCPLEAPMHIAIYARRGDVGGICRIHPPAAAAWACTGTSPPLLHGFGGIVEPVAVWDDPDLITSVAAAGKVAAALGEAPALLLRGNGALTVGATLDEALARAWCLEDRCRTALALGDLARPLTPDELERRRRWYDTETARLASWLHRWPQPPTEDISI
jgi:HCOMODA/2-hydroxy-3-carboxy-muconic semialdehyde decarboxylase